MYCKNCGKENHEDSIYCVDCGSPLEETENKTENNPSHEWFTGDGGKSVGPFSNTKMIELILSGELTRNSIVWNAGMEDWKPVHETSLKQYFSNTPPPLKGDKINNSFVWLLAVAPMIGWFIEDFVFGMLHGTTTYTYNREYWYITLVLNIVLLCLDLRCLKKAGVEMDYAKVWGLLLVPVYLYKRAVCTKQDKTCLITWIVCYILFYLF